MYVNLSKGLGYDIFIKITRNGGTDRDCIEIILLTVPKANHVRGGTKKKKCIREEGVQAPWERRNTVHGTVLSRGLEG